MSDFDFCYDMGWDDARDLGVLYLLEEDFDTQEKWLAYEAGFMDYEESIR